MSANRSQQRQQDTNPYCGFKSDSERRRALRSRDVRLAVIALFGACSSIGTALLMLHHFGKL